ncbi:MAG: tetratricopeptide repeat protein [Gemmatimonadales bacterium]
MALNPEHPGACHLFIHAVEAREPQRAVACAERLAGLMPGAGHLVHMPAHIYIRVGRYADAVTLNEHAVHADQSLLEGPAALRRGIYASGYYPHNHHFLSFAAAMMGASRLAIRHAFQAAAGVDPAVAAEIPWIEAITPIGYWTLVTFGHWDRLLSEPLPPPSMRFTTGMAYYARGVAFAARRRWAEAGAALDSVRRVAAASVEGDNRTALQIAERVLAGEIALRRGATALAIRSFRSAVVLEDGMAYTEPPVWYYPVRHSLGKALLAAGRFPEAEHAYREDLVRFPENGWSLYGLAQALKGQGRTAEAKAVLVRFNTAWAGADVRLVGSRF